MQRASRASRSLGRRQTLTVSRLAEQQTVPGVEPRWTSSTTQKSLGRGSAFGSDIAAAAINTSQNRLDSLSPSLHSFRSWLDESEDRPDLDTVPMSRSVYGDYLATLAKPSTVSASSGFASTFIRCTPRQ